MATKKRVDISKLIKTAGRSGEQLISAMNKEEQRVDNLKIEDYRKMPDNDGQIQMIWNAIVNTISSVGTEIHDDDDLDSEDDSEEKQFIEECLFSPVWKGGMDTTIEQTNKSMLRAFIEGFRLFEVVYKLGEDGRVRLQRLAPRSAGDDSGIKLVVDDRGNYVGFHQRINFGGQRIDVEVKNDNEIVKALKTTYGEEFGSLYGRSGLRAAWYHYDKAHKAWYLSHIGLEFGASKLRYLKTKGNMTEDDTADLVDKASKIHQISVLAIPENQAELILESVSDPAVMKVGTEIIDRHYSMIAKSVLAQFVDLGSSTSDTGSRALGDSQVTFFKDGLQSLATILIENPWNQVISSLIKLNFNRDIYPTLKVNKIADYTAELLFQTLLELVKRGDIADSIKKEVQKSGGELMGLDVNDEQIDKEIDQKQRERMDMNNAKVNAFQQPRSKIQSNDNKKIGLADLDGTSKQPIDVVNRQLYPEEGNINWIDIKNKLDTTEDRARVILRTKLNIQKNDIVEKYIRASREGRKAIRNVSIDLQENTGTYSSELRMLILEMLEYGKLVSAEELDKSAPVTTKKDRQAIEDMVELAVLEQTTRLMYRLIDVTNDALLKELPENEARLALENEYDTFFDKVLFPTIYALVPKALNFGIGITYKKYEKDIFAYRYTAVLDSSTTDFCRSLDGRIFQKTDPDYVMLTPPNHFGCRSRWVAITNKQQEEYNYRVDGRPTDTPVYSSISTFGTSEPEGNKLLEL